MQNIKKRQIKKIEKQIKTKEKHIRSKTSIHYVKT